MRTLAAKSTKRRVCVLAAVVSGAALINTVVAWSCAIWQPGVGRVSWLPEAESLVVLDRWLPNGTADQQLSGHMTRFIGASEVYVGHEPEGDDGEGGTCIEFQAGFPFRCFRGDIRRPAGCARGLSTACHRGRRRSFSVGTEIFLYDRYGEGLSPIRPCTERLSG